MESHRPSIARLMGAIAMAALACAVYRIDTNNGDVYRLYHEYVLAVVPMACLLLFGLMIAASDLRRLGECSPFLFGFEMTGWAVLFAAASFMAISFGDGSRLLDWLGPLTKWCFRSPVVVYANYDVVALHTLAIFIPEVILAVLGGWAMKYLNVTISRNERSCRSRG